MSNVPESDDVKLPADTEASHLAVTDGLTDTDILNSLSFVAANADMLDGTFAPALEAPTYFSVIFESPVSVVMAGVPKVTAGP